MNEMILKGFTIRLIRSFPLNILSLYSYACINSGKLFYD